MEEGLFYGLEKEVAMELEHSNSLAILMVSFILNMVGNGEEGDELEA